MKNNEFHDCRECRHFVGCDPMYMVFNNRPDDPCSLFEKEKEKEMMYENEPKTCCDERLCGDMIKARGIYDASVETLNDLDEILDTLLVFRSEISGSGEEREKIAACDKTTKPANFRENVCMINDRVFAIKNELDRILSEFR